jgi:hypothetical protein
MERYPDLYKTKKIRVGLSDGTIVHLNRDVVKTTKYESLNKNDLIGEPFDDKSIKSKGLGDTIEKITTFLRIKKFIDRISGQKDCGCETRKDKLNKWFPYKN